MASPGFQPLAEIEIDAVIPSQRGFTLTGQGADNGEYRLDLHFDLPLDPRTRSVLGELFSQSDLTISRRAPTLLRRGGVERVKKGAGGAGGARNS